MPAAGRKCLKRRKHLEAYNNWYGLGASVTWAQINNDATTLSERTKNHCKRTEKIYNDLFANPLNQQATMPFPIGAMELDEPPLRHLTLYDLHLLTHTLGFTREDEEDAQEIETYFTNLFTDQNPSPLCESAEKFMKLPVDSMYSTANDQGGRIYLAVDITCSDEQLVDNFRQTLRASRKSDIVWSDEPPIDDDEIQETLSYQRSSAGFNPRRSEYNQSSFKKWHDLAVLPYLDLSLWAKANGVSIKPSVFSKDIFKDSDREYDNSRTITHKVKPRASELMKRESLKTLNVQAQEEQRRQKERK